MAIREINECPRWKFAHELRVRSRGAAGDRAAKCQTKYAGLVPELHRSFEVVGCRGGFGESFQLCGILTCGSNIASMVGSLLEAASASKGAITNERADDDGEHYENVRPPRAERGGKAVSELQKNVLVQPTKEPAEYEFEGMTDPSEKTA